EQIWLTRSLFKPLTDQRHMIRVGLNADRPESLVACRLQRGTAARERVEHGPAWRGDQGDQPFHEREGLYGWMLNLRAVLPFNDGPFTLRRFRLVLEHREEPRRATRIAVPVLHRLWMLKGSRHRPAMASLSVCNTSHIWT